MHTHTHKITKFNDLRYFNEFMLLSLLITVLNMDKNVIVLPIKKENKRKRKRNTE